MAEVKEEIKKENAESKSVPAKFKDLIETVENMSVLELSELVKALEDKFGVSASNAAAMSASNAVGASVGGAEAEVEEKTSFTVELKSVGEKKIDVIRAIRELTELTLKDAKGLTDNVPKVVKEGVSKAEAEEAKQKLEAAGATVELK